MLPPLHISFKLFNVCLFHFFFGDTLATAGNLDLWNLPNTFTINRSSGGKSYQAYVRLGEKVLNNIYEYLNN